MTHNFYVAVYPGDRFGITLYQSIQDVYGFEPEAVGVADAQVEFPVKGSLLERTNLLKEV